MKRLWLLLMLLGALCISRASAAHELRPGALSLRELEPGRYAVQWSAPTLGQGVGQSVGLSVEPVFPPHCRLTGDRLDCGPPGLEGNVAFPALAGSLSRVVVLVQRRDGTSTTAVLSADSPSLFVKAGTGMGTGTGVVTPYTALGIEHILTGIDHLLFVLGLLLLVGFRRKLVVTVTAFTLAHSVTLAAAVLGLARVPQAPVEAVIALSILLLAVECSKKDADSLARRAPWAVAFSFGLLHGFGFAGALSDVGLPRDHVSLALLCFNVGVELGQLSVIAAACLLSRLLASRLQKVTVLETVAVYAVGALAAFWSIERTLAAFT